MSRDRRVEAVLITSAAPSFSTEQHYRSRRYTILMAVHLISFALAGALYYYAWWLGLVLLVITTPLPWVAVVLANSPSLPLRRASPAVDDARLLSLDTSASLAHRCGSTARNEDLLGSRTDDGMPGHHAHRAPFRSLSCRDAAAHDQRYPSAAERGTSLTENCRCPDAP